MQPPKLTDPSLGEVTSQKPWTMCKVFLGETEMRSSFECRSDKVAFRTKIFQFRWNEGLHSVASTQAHFKIQLWERPNLPMGSFHTLPSPGEFTVLLGECTVGIHEAMEWSKTGECETLLGPRLHAFATNMKSPSGSCGIVTYKVWIAGQVPRIRDATSVEEDPPFLSPIPARALSPFQQAVFEGVERGNRDAELKVSHQSQLRLLEAQELEDRDVMFSEWYLVLVREEKYKFDKEKQRLLQGRNIPLENLHEEETIAREANKASFIRTWSALALTFLCNSAETLPPLLFEAPEAAERLLIVEREPKERYFVHITGDEVAARFKLRASYLEGMSAYDAMARKERLVLLTTLLEQTQQREVESRHSTSEIEKGGRRYLGWEMSQQEMCAKLFEQEQLSRGSIVKDFDNELGDMRACCCSEMVVLLGAYMNTEPVVREQIYTMECELWSRMIDELHRETRRVQRWEIEMEFRGIVAKLWSIQETLWWQFCTRVEGMRAPSSSEGITVDSHDFVSTIFSEFYMILQKHHIAMESWKDEMGATVGRFDPPAYRIPRPLTPAEKGLLSHLCTVTRIACVLTTQPETLRTLSTFSYEEGVLIPPRFQLCLQCSAVIGVHAEYHSCTASSSARDREYELWLVEAKFMCTNGERSDWYYMPML